MQEQTERIGDAADPQKKIGARQQKGEAEQDQNRLDGDGIPKGGDRRADQEQDQRQHGKGYAGA